MIYTASYNSPVGKLLLAAKEDAVTGLWIEGQKYFLSSVKEEMQKNDSLPVLQSAKTWLDKYFNGEKPEISEIKLSLDGSDFAKSVWKILCKIPYGQTTTYGQIAKEIAAERNVNGISAQAAGGAVGHNPVSIIIPCHRVVGSNGSLTGYAGGIDKKIKLLIHENVDISRFYIPKKR